MRLTTLVHGVLGKVLDSTIAYYVLNRISTVTMAQRLEMSCGNRNQIVVNNFCVDSRTTNTTLFAVSYCAHGSYIVISI